MANSSQSSSQGQVSYNVEPFKYRRERGVTYYELSNHLGNVLVTVTDMKIGISIDGDDFAEYYEATVVSANDYYPFGCPENSGEVRWQGGSTIKARTAMASMAKKKTKNGAVHRGFGAGK